jgi:hypothetical protein
MRSKYLQLAAVGERDRHPARGARLAPGAERQARQGTGRWNSALESVIL